MTALQDAEVARVKARTLRMARAGELSAHDIVTAMLLALCDNDTTFLTDLSTAVAEWPALIGALQVAAFGYIAHVAARQGEQTT